MKLWLVTLTHPCPRPRRFKNGKLRRPCVRDIERFLVHARTVDEAFGAAKAFVAETPSRHAEWRACAYDREVTQLRSDSRKATEEEMAAAEARYAEIDRVRKLKFGGGGGG